MLSFGEALIDLIVADGAANLEEAGTFTARPGGAPANVTVALARLGVPSAFVGIVGDDPFGRRLRST
ncbi:MAG: PfkB family carbohydrate kinase, partial [Chloroflexota bacterium]|nr:PfkB family carbohydrate kinase [Chloroflexota bacterium]